MCRHLIYDFLGYASHTERYLDDRFSCFCKALGHDQHTDIQTQTDRQTDRRLYSSSLLPAVLACWQCGLKYSFSARL